MTFDTPESHRNPTRSPTVKLLYGSSDGSPNGSSSLELPMMKFPSYSHWWKEGSFYCVWFRGGRLGSELCIVNPLILLNTTENRLHKKEEVRGKGTKKEPRPRCHCLASSLKWVLPFRSIVTRCVMPCLRWWWQRSFLCFIRIKEAPVSIHGWNGHQTRLHKEVKELHRFCYPTREQGEGLLKWEINEEKSRGHLLCHSSIILWGLRSWPSYKTLEN